MSWVEDARKLMQDFVAPELLAIAARLDAAETADNEQDSRAAERHNASLDKLESTRREIMLQLELAITRSKLEELQARRSMEPAPQDASWSHA